MSTVSEKIKKGLEEIFEHVQGKRTLRIKLIELPGASFGIQGKKMEQEWPKKRNR